MEGVNYQQQLLTRVVKCAAQADTWWTIENPEAADTQNRATIEARKYERSGRKKSADEEKGKRGVQAVGGQSTEKGLGKRNTREACSDTIVDSKVPEPLLAEAEAK